MTSPHYYIKTDLDRGKIYNAYKFQNKFGEWVTNYQIENFEPSLFYQIPSNKNPQYIPLGSKTNERTLTRKTFSSSFEMNNFIREIKEIGNAKIYGDKNVVRQFLSENYSHVNSKAIEFTNIRKGFFDIEIISAFEENGKLIEYGFPKPDEAKFPICALTYYDSKDDAYYV